MHIRPVLPWVNSCKLVKPDAATAITYRAHQGFVDVNVLRALTAAAAWFMTLPVVMLYALAAFLLTDKPLEPRNPRDERSFWRTRNHHRSY